ncbi:MULTISPECIES: dodecin family protein [Thermovenabulum]|uniref:Dodecin n=1 Tax=Thermovenabulum gondwanense TaxID=520767 RepID=A0A162MGJ9_9FIRM|nr:dodecin family protein [Thermovenabulum gondwanense]KYO65792.1 Dodecin [Thermovenabulum gondwanense]
MTVKVIEVVGESKNSWQEAIENAVKDASKTIRNITGVEVLNQTANVQNGKIVEYKADVAIAFKVDGTTEA